MMGSPPLPSPAAGILLPLSSVPLQRSHGRRGDGEGTLGSISRWMAGIASSVWQDASLVECDSPRRKHSPKKGRCCMGHDKYGREKRNSGPGKKGT
jgi:hypothetical protein